MHYTLIAALALASVAAAAPATLEARAKKPWAPPGCDNDGVKFFLYKDATPEDSEEPYDWNPNSLNKMDPIFKGTRNKIGYDTDDISTKGVHKASIYGSQEFDTQHFAVRHTGYFFAAIKGKYRVVMKDSDDACYVYAGEDCADVKKKRGGGNRLLAEQILKQEKVEDWLKIDAGFWVPFEIRCGNVMAGPYTLNIKIFDPEDNLILGDEAPANKASVVHKLCPNNKYPTWKILEK